MLERHDLIYPSKVGRKYALDFSEKNSNIPKNIFKEVLENENIPAIIKRQESFEEGFVEVGFSSHYFLNDNRVRILSKIPENCIEKVVSPFDILTFYNFENIIFVKETLEKIMPLTKAYNIPVGIYGSYALKIVTSLEYTNANSDLDIYLKKLETSDLYRFYKDFEKLDLPNVDIEIAIGNSFSVKFKELFKGQKTVLAKGFRELRLLDIKEIFDNQFD